jgi:hypothetical protein
MLTTITKRDTSSISEAEGSDTDNIDMTALKDSRNAVE